MWILFLFLLLTLCMAFIGTYQTLLWLIAATMLVLCEIGIPSLVYFLSFAAGALGGAVTSLLTSSLELQLISALVITAVALIFLKKWAAKESTKKIYYSRTESLVGKRALLLTDIYFKPGTLEIEGQVWSAVSEDGKPLAALSLVQIVRLQGVCLVVKAVENFDNSYSKD